MYFFPMAFYIVLPRLYYTSNIFILSLIVFDIFTALVIQTSMQHLKNKTKKKHDAERILNNTDVFFSQRQINSLPPFSPPQVLQSALHRIRHGRTGSRLANLHRQHQHVSMWPRRLIMMGGDNHNEFYFQCSVGARRSASAPADSSFLIIAN